MLHVKEGETVAVNCILQLHKMLYDNTGGALKDFFRLIQSTNPSIVVVAEQESEHNDAILEKRVSNSLILINVNCNEFKESILHMLEKLWQNINPFHKPKGSRSESKFRCLREPGFYKYGNWKRHKPSKKGNAIGLKIGRRWSLANIWDSSDAMNEDKEEGERSASCTATFVLKLPSSCPTSQSPPTRRRRRPPPPPTKYLLPQVSIFKLCFIFSFEYTVKNLNDVYDNMSKKKPTVIWKECADKTFLEACIHELTTNGREGSGFKASSWKIVAEKLKNEHGLLVDKKQMKNHYDYFKAKYTAWVKLKNKTGNIYNPITNTFNMTDEEWDAEGNVIFIIL
ncbi:hypothetical protein LXL04_033285 [Taraxacum kok-saghyz]